MITQRRYLPNFDYDEWRPVSLNFMDGDGGGEGDGAGGSTGDASNSSSDGFADGGGGYRLDSSSSDSIGGYGYGYDAAVSGPSYDGGISSSSESPEIRRPGRGVESGW